jgi:hypothetical protein
LSPLGRIRRVDLLLSPFDLRFHVGRLAQSSLLIV